MPRIAEIINRLKTIDARQAAIEKEADEKNGGAFSPEARSEYDTLQKEYDTLKTEKAQLEEDAQRRQARNNRATSDFVDPVPRRSTRKLRSVLPRNERARAAGETDGWSAARP